jgi:hypothetical protein
MQDEGRWALPDQVVDALWLCKVVVVRAEAVVGHAQKVRSRAMAREVSACTVQAADIDGAQVGGVVRLTIVAVVTVWVHGR